MPSRARVNKYSIPFQIIDDILALKSTAMKWKSTLGSFSTWSKKNQDFVIKSLFMLDTKQG